MIEQVIEARAWRPTSPSTDTIVVGVADRLAGSERALWEAALWATRQHLDVTLLTAAGSRTAPRSSCPTPRRRRREARHLISDAAHRLARTTDADQRIHATVVPGAADAALIAASTAARLLVLQRGGVGTIECLASGSTTDTVIGRASCPVLVVHDDDQTGLRRGLLVIIDTLTSVGPSLGAAFPEALRRGRGLTVLVLSPSSRADVADWWSEVAAENRLSTWQRRCPSVPVTEMVINRFDAATASRLAAGCELLVVARRDSTRHGRSSFGGVARRLVDGARCPVLVVPPAAPTSSRPTPVESPEDALALRAAVPVVPSDRSCPDDEPTPAD